MRRVLFLFLMAAVAAPAQEIHQSIDWAKLAAKAVESVDVNLDANLLSLTAKFLSGDKPEEAKLKQAVGNIKGIYVKSLTFEKEGEYSMADVDKIRALLKPPQWSKVVDIQSKKGGDNAGVFMRIEGDQIRGMVVLAFEPKELTVVNIVGTVDTDFIREFGGKLGIPKIELEKKSPKR